MTTEAAPNSTNASSVTIRKVLAWDKIRRHYIRTIRHGQMWLDPIGVPLADQESLEEIATVPDGLALYSRGHSVWGMPIEEWKKCPKIIWWAFLIQWWWDIKVHNRFFAKPGKLSESNLTTL